MSAALNRRWFGRSDALRADPSRLELTREEQAWISAHPVVRVGLDPSWAPVEFFDEQRQPQGISVAYLVFSAADVAYLGGIDALHGKVVAVVDAESVHEWLREQHPDIRLLPVPDTPAALRAVTHGEAFAFVGNLATTSYYIGASGLTEVKVLGETPFVYRLGMAVHRDAPLLRAILQKGLDALPRHDRDAIYHNCGENGDWRKRWRKRGRCGLARPCVLAGESPAWVIVSREPSIEPCGASGNSRVDV